MKNSITNLDKEKINNTISSNLQKHKEIFAVYLFGSYVTDQQFRDIDLGILTGK